MTRAEQFQREARAYVCSRLNRAGGWREAVAGLWWRTLPDLVGSTRGVSFVGACIVLLRVLLLVGAASLSVFMRKTYDQAAPVEEDAEGWEAILNIFQNLDSVDLFFMTVAVLVVGAPKVLDSWRRNGKRPDRRLAYKYFVGALRRLPLVPPDGGLAMVEPSLREALEALRFEVSELIGDRGAKDTDATLLVFCDPLGQRMEVLARTDTSRPTRRPVDAHRLQAYYVGTDGRWMVEHQFGRSRGTPFKPVRATTPGVPAPYKSILFIPIVVSDPGPPHAGGMPDPAAAVDRCIGVVCVHSEKPYRFWRWGDHRLVLGGFGNIVFERASPYIALVAHTLRGRAHEVALVR
ncbi:hypothetical protein OOT46_08415 [Aquabacterium sp. A7-Y]|uniref:hypothetical protein n=1 Tax=Aquabacterium sp. A7-Y TaxID=1349605 RepID=UPI00223E3E67|nr:hypothetical protein [Aquabacterium sp. A7-Y]MCW7537870.1 hypothetical protein [Aquabacterium sp. A7-Y]